MTTTTIFATLSGENFTSNATYSTVRNGTGTITPYTTYTLNGQALNGGVYSIWQAYFDFDTSSIPDGDTITGVAFALDASGNQSTTDHIQQIRLYDWGGTIEAADYRSGTALGSLTLLCTFDTASINLTGYNTFTENGSAFSSAINKTGTTRCVGTTDRIVSNTAPSTLEYITWDGTNVVGTSRDPKITITHVSNQSVTVTTGIASAGAFGSSKLISKVAVGTGIVSASAFGTPTMTRIDLVVSCTGITSTGAFGSIQGLHRRISVSGIKGWNPRRAPFINY